MGTCRNSHTTRWGSEKKINNILDFTCEKQIRASFTEINLTIYTQIAVKIFRDSLVATDRKPNSNCGKQKRKTFSFELVTHSHDPKRKQSVHREKSHLKLTALLVSSLEPTKIITLLHTLSRTHLHTKYYAALFKIYRQVLEVALFRRIMRYLILKAGHLLSTEVEFWGAFPINCEGSLT